MKAKTLPERFAKEIISIVSRDRAGRRVSRLCAPRDWQRAVETFAPLPAVAVISGFFVPAAEAPETDGPGGAAVLARAFCRLGKKSEIWTDEYCLPVMKAAAAAIGYPKEFVKIAPKHIDGKFKGGLLFIERLGRAADGGYYNFRKSEISKWTPPLDGLSAKAAERGIPTLGIGDGGNEVGMGNFYKELSELLPEYASCLCTVKTGVALAVDVSNWGAYALASALSYVWGVWCGAEAEEEEAMLSAENKLGAVDGISRLVEPTVDGFDIITQTKIISSLKELWLSGRSC